MEAYPIPAEFFAYNLVFLLVFIAVTLLVSIFAYKIYKLTKQSQLKLFSLAFLSFSIGYLIRLIINLVIISKLNDTLQGWAVRREIFPLQVLTNNLHAVFIMVGLILLVYMSLKVKDAKILVLLFGILFLPLIFSITPLFLFHTLTSFLLFFIIIYYYKNYKKHKHLQNFLVMLAFIFMFLGSFSLIFSFHQGPGFFNLGRVFDLIGYLCILATLILTIRKK